MPSPPRKKKAGNRPPAKDFGQPASPSRLKLWSFRLLLGLGVPAVCLGAIELTLRLAGVGYPTQFLLPSHYQGRDLLVQNNQFGWRFFGPAMARLPEPICLEKDKPANTVRVVVFGESAALGDPLPHFGLARMLQAMLEARYPGTHFEIVNAAIVAINSNVILPIARDCRAVDADVWVIYMGNNEVVGPFGAGTVFGQQTPPLPLIRANLALKATRTGQFIDSLSAHLHKPPADKSEWGGMEMFINQQVRANDPRMNAVYDHFSRNLSDIVDAGRQSGAGVVVSTLAVNLKDCAPFASAHRTGLADSAKAQWDTLYHQGIDLQTAGKFTEAAAQYQQAAQIDNQYAELAFRQGDCALALGDAAVAQTYFASARNLDTLRFRCDNRLNDLIRQDVSQHHDDHVLLADTERAFTAQCPNGIPGDEMFYDHVHLTFDGNYLLALTTATQIASLLPAKVTSQASASSSWPSEAQCIQRLAWSDFDQQKGLADMYSRLSEPPFTSQFTHDQKVQKLRESLSLLSSAAQPSGMKIAETICAEALQKAPDDGILLEQLANLQQESGELPAALTNAQRAVDLQPADAEAWSQLGVIQAKFKNYDQATAAFRQAFQLNPEDVWALENLAQALKYQGLSDQAIQEYRHALAIKPRFELAWLGLGQLYEAMGQTAKADDCYHEALTNRISRASELKVLANFCESRGWREAAATNYADAIRLGGPDPALDLVAGQNFAASGHPREAEYYFSEATRLLPDSLQAHFLYGLALGQNQKTSEAITQFRETVRIKPDLPEAHFNLAMALFNATNYNESLAEFDKLLEIDPNNTKARQYADALRQQLAAKAH